MATNETSAAVDEIRVWASLPHRPANFKDIFIPPIFS
jgi:hypothetical protein